MTSVSQILSFLPSFLTGGSKTLDDDPIDRWNHHVTTLLLVAMSVSVTALQHLGSPIACAVPEKIKMYEKYADNLCWINDTYVVHFHEEIPNATPEERLINYYQWVPMFLLLQALLFYAPSAFWDFFHPKCGVDLSGIISTAAGVKVFDDKDESTRKSMDYVVRQVDKYLEHYPRGGHRFCSGPWRFLKRMGRKQGNFLVMSYMSTKLLYLLNSGLQFWMLGYFLSSDFYSYGFDVIASWKDNEMFPHSPAFPRTTLCDLHVREFGNNIHRHVLQCVLPINFYNEKLFLIVWFWLIITMALNFYGLLLWFLRIFRLPNTFVKHYMKLNKHLHGDLKMKHYKPFVRDYLRKDGVFILRMLKINVNGLFVSEIIEKLLAFSKDNHPEIYSDPNRNDESFGNGHLLHAHSQV